MKPIVLTLFSVVVIVTLLALTEVTTGTVPPASIPPATKKMRAFKSDQELKRYFQKLAANRKYRRTEMLSAGSVAATEPAPAKAAGSPSLLRGRGDDESITNTQHTGVDEGDIVKLHGNHLLILRRGRLFTVAIGESTLKPVSTIDAFGPDINPEDTWYDEMLVSGDTIVIIGYSYQRGGTEVGLFNVDAQGQLSYRSTYNMRSDDYYSSRNYASRLIGEKLIVYSPLDIYSVSDDLFDSLPAVRKWHKGATPKEFKRIVPAQRIYRPETPLNTEDDLAFHTVTVCDLSNGGFDCQATSVFGPSGNVFYVSPDSVYVWATSWSYEPDRSRSILFRMPLDGSGPSALRVYGSPVDQFSFLESDDYYLNVLVRSEGKGDGMWSAEAAEGDVALLRVPLNTFSDGSLIAPANSYRRLPKPEGDTFQNRFIGNYLLYGTGSGWLEESEKNKGAADLHIVEWANPKSYMLKLPHGVDRIEQLGNDAVVVGDDETDLHFSAIRLSDQPEVVSRYTRRGASQGETRSHGFFYKPDSETGGLLGLPISRPGRPGYEQLFESSAAILFLRNDGLQFREIGELEAQTEKAVDDKCRASCVDWYGNARPIFIRGRMFALLGYELVEGTVEDGRIRELGRTSYAP